MSDSGSIGAHWDNEEQRAQAYNAVGMTPQGPMNQPGAQTSTGMPDLLNGSIKIDGVNYLSEQELEQLDLDSKILYIFLLVQQKDNQRIGAKLDEISGITDRIEGANQIFNTAAAARNEAGKDGKTEAPASVMAFSDAHNLGLKAGKKYNREDWDVNMELIQKQQNAWVYESEVVTYDLEKMMSEAATNMQLATKMLGTLQSLREKTVGALSFR